MCIIVGTLMGEDPASISDDLTEIHISAICEVMNQMMGASATALSEFLGTTVNISTPQSFDVGEPEAFKEKYFPEEDGMVVVRFRLEIEDKLNSEFMNIMSIGLAKRLLEPFADNLGGSSEPEPAPAPAATSAPAAAGASSGGTMSQEEINAMLAGGTAASAPAPAASSGGTMSQEEINAMLAGGTAASAPAPAPAASSGGTMSQEEINAMLAGSAAAPAPAPAAPAPAPAAPAPAAAAPAPAAPYPYPPMSMDPMMLQLLNQMQQTQMQMMEMMKNTKPEPAKPESTGGSSIIKPLSSQQMQDDAGDGEEDKTNQEMLLKVPLEVSVEIGRTKRLVRDILEFTQGTLVVLDKMAGEQVDLFVNGQCIARGDIVVVEDNFGIRITEIVTKEINPESL